MQRTQEVICYTLPQDSRTYFCISAQYCNNFPLCDKSVEVHCPALNTSCLGPKTWYYKLLRCQSWGGGRLEI